ncbi:phosphoribosylformylglycinamidine synthase [Thermosipho melanesiensis]|uniref:Phosphoribosylformylglycinamidine synthase subunit PurL n=2 Tax=Thermosipho melanesiensis TaxID=46541 RepID=A6LMD8_THEM4|nr:phosphoribosylformylglycinamidine synthase subunit PurL [Thermosipho melanesiensis]ABR31089.1 phosphoribosylformylglycinamidine synthase II [Thermosipho melanesiensis BI429]APT74184.1 phosphoribosylformylglycinamidine synthase [Thermosipho melanesiensis]OOC36128.1 phosphoribosylformylglycinamidine synthase [Thermosipho melanesiensis]OOC36945.1 phosphoribosylformylglycinamidine synthase [Thermosipho melanesiensis]OOC37697.1 phosphoribosylformylglycinamidine synthase [Thermosipho melanesiensi
MKYLNILEEKLERKATFTEKEAFTVMWSEHCGYSHTKRYIKQLPLISLESGNAGLVSLNEDYALAFKIESHNHPSAIEPYNGAATGVGGIIRDVLAMGARPTAILDSLHMHKIIDGIIEGIADYGNSIGVPTVGGELRISDAYRYNPLVNVMAAGIVKHKDIIPSKAMSKGQVIIVFGGATGRDGIHGASFASEDLTGEKANKLSIQVGDPFAEKMLIEAFLRMVEEGLVEGAQDLGAGGVLSATSELVAKGGFGAVIHLERLPLREPDMNPVEILISESQERMAVITSPEKAERVLNIVKDHLLYGAILGEVTDDGIYHAMYKGETILKIPAQLLSNAPEEEIYDFFSESLPKNVSITFSDVDASQVYTQYDHMVGTDTVLLPGYGPAVMRIKGTDIFYSLLTHSRADIGDKSPYWGSFIAVLESVRKTLSVGGEPFGITDCINYGDPDVEPMGLSAMMKGLKDACEFSNVGVASGNASLYNTNKGIPIPPTMVIGMVGKVKKVVKPKKGDIYLIGWEDFSLEREKILWGEIRKQVSKGNFVISSTRYDKLTYLKNLNLKLPPLKHSPIHQLVVVIGNNVRSDLPIRKI